MRYPAAQLKVRYSIFPVWKPHITPSGGKYQPQVPELEQPKVEEMKPVKQNVTYDSSTGKMYEELGSTNSGSAGTNSSSSRPSYFQSYQPGYPYSSMQPPQYMGSSYSSPGYVGPYDRLEPLQLTEFKLFES